MERTHLLRADLAWMPRRARRTSQLIRGVAWTAIGATVAGSMAIAPVMAVMWKGLLVGGAGAAAIADRAARVAMRRQVEKMTRGELALAELDAREEGELVVVRGTIEAAEDELLRGLVIDATGVYRRLVFEARGTTWV